MKEETIAKINELLESRDKGEVELGLQMVRTRIRENHPCNIVLEEGKDYLVTLLRKE